MKVRQPQSEPRDVQVSRKQAPPAPSGRADPLANPWGIWLPTAGLDPQQRRRTAALAGLRTDELEFVGEGGPVQLVAGHAPPELVASCAELGLEPQVVARSSRLGLVGIVALVPIVAMAIIGPAGTVAAVLGALAVGVWHWRRNARRRDALRWSASRLLALRSALGERSHELRRLKREVLEAELASAAEAELLDAVDVELAEPTEAGASALRSRFEDLRPERLLEQG